MKWHKFPKEKPDVYAMVLPKSLGEVVKSYNNEAYIDPEKVKLHKSYDAMIRERNKQVPKGNSVNYGLIFG